MTQLLTEHEAASRLLISERTLRTLRSKGSIRYVRIGARKIAYRPEDCDEYVAANVCVDVPLPHSAPAAKRKQDKRGARHSNVVPFSQRGR